MASAHEEAHAEMFRRLNEVESKVGNTNGYLKPLVTNSGKELK